MKNIIIATLIILAVIMIIYYAKSNKKISKILIGSFLGIGLLYPLHYLLLKMGIQLAVNYITLAIAGILGIPGLALLCVGGFIL